MYRPVNHGYIEVVVGPMYSGKSEELIRRLKRAKIAPHLFPQLEHLHLLNYKYQMLFLLE